MSTADVVEARETRALLQIALEKMKRNRFADARVDLEEALRLEPAAPLVLSYYGLCLSQLGRAVEGLSYCERAARLHSEDVMVRVNLGKVHRRVGDLGAAHRSFIHAWQIDKRHAAPAAELARMGIRRPPVLRFLPRSNWCNRQLGQLRAYFERGRSSGPRR